MAATTRDEAPIAVEGGGLEVRVREIGGDLSVGFFRLPEGTDFTEALKGLPGDMCPCPHWGYLLKGRLLMRTGDGEQVYEEGQAFYWGPGHIPVALADTEYVDFSPTAEFHRVVEHVRGGAG
ncbi:MULTISPECIES: hypothetical protein [Streptomyces]|uniref:hypothetical protein n=2 Tax=Streptomyces TaxID=1883 RepID=UPI0004BDB42E|nr:MULTISPECIES: hypothetical protein [Streptomyces]KOU26746.1 hypothetical protein ADK49_03265 [Streptomyces sp. WM6349]KOU90804.1 hypothetical protein ADK92_33760 [Streptomyces sp. XY533]KOU92694.1 hypothetical protein ADK94_06660 [Streptomyces sp. XY593]KOV02560.1 hypothetical protein ADK91_19935 [Streptomyces sp. XY511]KOV52467.1 hypothetical protein ADK98_06610 [Streptomyces sp. H036]